jgi:hypothetical protein
MIVSIIIFIILMMTLLSLLLIIASEKFLNHLYSSKICVYRWREEFYLEVSIDPM